MVKDEILKEKAKRIIESGDNAKMDFLTIVASHKGSIMADSLYTSFRRFKEEHGEKKFEEIRDELIEEGIISVSSSGGIRLRIKNEKGDYDYQKGEELSIFLGKLIFDNRPQMIETIEKHLKEPEGKEFFRYISEKDGILTSDGARPEIEEAIGKKSYNRIIKDLVELGLLIEYSWSSRKHGYHGYMVLPSVDLFIKEKLSPFELSSLKRELEDNGLSGSEIYRCFDTLRKIYLGQNIHRGGILQSSFSEYRKEIETLLKYGFIREDKWYSHNLYLTTEKGSKAGKLLLEELIKKQKSKAVDAILNLPHNLIGFLLFDYMAPSLTYPVEREYPFDWREPLVADSRIWICRNKLLSKLEELGLSVKTYLFVSTRGGELRGKHYVISEEVRRFLKNCTAYTGGLYGKEKKMSLLYDFFSKARPILLIGDINEVRERYYNEMESLDLTEEEIEGFVNQMAKKGISSKYDGLLSDRVPFSIKDDSRYNIYIKEALIKPVIHYLLGKSEKRVDIEDEEVEKERTETVHRIEREKIKSLGLISKEERMQLYGDITDFELELRQFIKEELKKKFGDKWLNQGVPKDIGETLDNRKNKEIKEGIGPEPEIINYMDFSDYKKIVLSNWKIFVNCFKDKDKLSVRLDDLNNLGRMPIMHVRSIDKEKVGVTTHAIRWLRSRMSNYRSK